MRMIASGAASSSALAAPRARAFGTSGGNSRATATAASAVVSLSTVASQALGCQSVETAARWVAPSRSEEHTSELQSRLHLVCRLLLEKKKKKIMKTHTENEDD